MNLLHEKIKDIAEKIVGQFDFFLIDLIIRGNPNNRVIEVFIDGEKNISAEDCAAISRSLNDEIEKENLISSNYRLDVSSPGTDRPLIYQKQFPKHIGRNFEVSYTSENEIKKFSGKLTDITGDDFSFLLKNNQQIIINFNSIKKAKVIAGFFPKG